jgi:hypothetical protein
VSGVGVRCQDAELVRERFVDSVEFLNQRRCQGRARVDVSSLAAPLDLLAELRDFQSTHGAGASFEAMCALLRRLHVTVADCHVPTWLEEFLKTVGDRELLAAKNGHRFDACGAPRRDDRRSQCGDGKEHGGDGKAE